MNHLDIAAMVGVKPSRHYGFSGLVKLSRPCSCVAKSNHQDMSKVVKLNSLDIVAVAVESNCPDFEALVARLNRLDIVAPVAS